MYLCLPAKIAFKSSYKDPEPTFGKFMGNIENGKISQVV